MQSDKTPLHKVQLGNLPQAIAVHKFGGSSLADASRFHAVADIILAQQAGALWVVVSAPGDTTDQLLDIIEYADSELLALKLQQLAEHLNKLIFDSFADEANTSQLLQQQAVEQKVQQWLSELPLYLAGQQYNDVLAIGERFSSLLLSAVLTAKGRQATAVDARDFLVLAEQQVNWQLSEQKLAAIKQENQIQVVTGYIARDAEGRSITLGRNGSDYSATILGRLLRAERVSIWTDVDAIYSADPRKVKQAKPYRLVSWQQAETLARLGNPVLHARTLSALEQSCTELEVRSSFTPEKAGCRVVAETNLQAEFITELADIVLLHIPQAAAVSATQLALQLQQPVVALPDDGEYQQWLVRAATADEAVTLLAVAGIDAVWQPQRYHAVAWIKPLAGKQIPPAVTLYLQLLQPEHQYETAASVIWLFRQPLTELQLTELHQRCVGSVPVLHVLVAGTGNVGSEFLSLLAQQQLRLAGSVQLCLSGVFNSRTASLQPDIPAAEWQQAFAAATEYRQEQLLDYIRSLSGFKVLVDITPSQVFALSYPQFIAAGCHLISANKQGVTLPGGQYQHILQALQQHNRHWLSNTTVGAGIPVQRVLQELLNAGDQVTQISGIFSGTLSWLLCQFDGQQAFSELVLEAQQQGLTEPDPRDDLSGKDVQRKLLVLARELGVELELEQIALQPLLPAELAGGDWDIFWSQRHVLDKQLAAAYSAAAAENRVLRYVATLDISLPVPQASVELKAVTATDPLAAIQPCDNIFVIRSGWYQQNPLVLKGPGAGRQVTAGGIHADLAILVQRLIQSGGRQY